MKKTFLFTLIIVIISNYLSYRYLGINSLFTLVPISLFMLVVALWVDKVSFDVYHTNVFDPTKVEKHLINVVKPLKDYIADNRRVQSLRALRLKLDNPNSDNFTTTPRRVPRSIETPIDKLLYEIKRVEKTTVDDLATAIGVDRKQVEEWLVLLENKGLIEIRYPVVGTPEVIIKEGIK